MRSYGTRLEIPSGSRHSADPYVSDSRRKERELQWASDRSSTIRNQSMVYPIALLVMCAVVGVVAYSRASMHTGPHTGMQEMGTIESGEPHAVHLQSSLKSSMAAAKPSSSVETGTTATAATVGKSLSWGAVKFTVSNPSYPQETAGLGYPHLTVGLVAEPYRTTHLKAEVNSDSDDISDDEALETCSWTILQKTGIDDSSIYDYNESPTILSGQYVTHMFTSPATYHVSSTCTTTLGNVHTMEEDVECIYIRRELRDLTDMDLDIYLEAFKTMAMVTTTDGKELYGSHFHHLDHFVQMHLNAASLRSHDQIHDGMGVVTQHASITSKFELALQAIDPTIAVPYWDYTRDSAKLKGHYKGDASNIFKSDWWVENFGATSSLDHHISTGKFANQVVGLANASSPSDTSSPYGFLRAPWNLNPSPYVSRYHKNCGENPGSMYSWPTCMNHWALTFKKKTWYDWIWDVSYSPHGPVHVWVGGMGGDCIDADISGFDLTDSEQGKLKNLMFVLLKNLWRYEKIEFPTSCSTDATEDCVIKCNSAKMHDGAFLNKFEEQLIDVVGLSVSDWDNATMQSLADTLICGKAFWPGDHLEAASPVEASFWPIHPTLDRLLQYKMMVDDFAETIWDIDNQESKMYCEYYYDSSCKGHHAYDLTFSEVITRSEGTYTFDYVSNMELRTALTPDTYSVSYIYNNFEWEHCNDLDLNVHFPSVE